VLPKYLQISQEITETIRRGELAVGEKAPSENEIMTKYGVSNTTARRALQEIERSGWVRRVKARGTFVRENRIGRSVDRILGFTRNMREAGLVPSTEVLSVRVRKESHALKLSGRQYQMPGPLCMLERLRLADGVPIMKEKRYISLQLCPGIEQKNLEESLYDIYESYGHELTEIHQSLSAIMLERKQDLDIFELDQVVPAFMVEGATFCGKELILEVEESLYRGDLYKFMVKAIR
jgi:GntR family transcriptional regulator